MVLCFNQGIDQSFEVVVIRARNVAARPNVDTMGESCLDEQVLLHINTVVHLFNARITEIWTKIFNEFLGDADPEFHPPVSEDILARLAHSIRESFMDQLETFTGIGFTQDSCYESVDRTGVAVVV